MTLAYSWHSFFSPHMLICQANYIPKMFDTNIHSLSHLWIRDCNFELK